MKRLIDIISEDKTLYGVDGIENKVRVHLGFQRLHLNITEFYPGICFLFFLLSDLPGNFSVVCAW